MVFFDSCTYTLNKRFASMDQLMNSYGRAHIKIDLGCGYNKPAGYIGIDNMSGTASQIANRDNEPDILMDLCSGHFPFEDNSVAEVRASHFLEHSNLEHIINETHRVLKPAGRFDLIVPYANSAEGLYPGHIVYLTEKWFHDNPNFQSKFRIVKETYYPSREWRRLRPFSWFIPFRLARTFLFNACWQMRMDCIAKKK
jgi:predicted SAM-dependent methyltransferase